MTVHTCSEKDSIKNIVEELHLLKTKNAVIENKIETIEGEQINMKSDIRKLNDELTKGNSKLFISIISSSLIIIVCLLINFFTK